MDGHHLSKTERKYLKTFDRMRQSDAPDQWWARFFENLAHMVDGLNLIYREVDLTPCEACCGYVAINALAYPRASEATVYDDFLAVSGIEPEELTRTEFHHALRAWWKARGTAWYLKYTKGTAEQLESEQDEE